jgi:hypothetical protein
LTASLFIRVSAIPNIHSIDEDIGICLQAGKRNSARRDGRSRSFGETERQKPPQRKLLQTSSFRKSIMNTKSFLIATLLAAASSATFANEAAPAAPAAQKTEAVQVAQANTAVRNIVPSARAGSNAMTTSCANTYNEATSMIVCSNNDGRTRAQVREETRAWLNSPEGRAARAQTVGAF